MSWIWPQFRRFQKLISPILERVLKYQIIKFWGINHIVVAAYDTYKGVEATPLRLIKEYVDVGSVVIDVGAHYGYFTTRFSELVGSNGQVIALEPNVSSCAVLERRVNRQRLKNVQVLSCAAWSATTNLHLVEDGPLGAMTRVSITTGAEHGETKGRSIDDIVGDLQERRVSFIKIDVEGAELEVLNGALMTLRDLRPTILCEVGSENQTDPEQHVTALFSLIRKTCYECLDVGTKTRLTKEELISSLSRLRYIEVLICPQVKYGSYR